MNENQLIKKIEELKQIKPNKEWVFSTKENILKRGQKAEILNHWLFNPIQRPALVFAFRGVIILVVILAGAFFYLYYLNSNSQLSLSNISFLQSQETKKLTASLEDIQENLNKITLSLDNLKNSKSAKDTLAVSGVVKETALRGKELVEQIKKQSGSERVSASLGEIEDVLGELGEVSYDMQMEMIEQALNDLKQWTLNEEDQERLIKAEEYYEQGKQDEAIILIMKIMEN